MKTALVKSWKTTVCGLIVAVILILKQIGNLLDDDPETVMSVEMILGALAALGIGVCARDNGVSSREAGAKLIVFGLCCLLLLGGCGQLANKAPSQDQVLRVTVDAYAGTMDTLTDFYKAGKIDDELVGKIDVHRKMAFMALEEWRACLRDGKPVSEAIRQFTTHFAALIEAEKILNEG